MTAYSVESGESANWTLQPPSTPSARMIARAAAAQPLVHGIGQRLDGRDDDRVTGVDPERIDVLHRAHGDARVVASRMTSYSISCQPTRHFSTMTWPIGLARSRADPLAVRPARSRRCRPGATEGERRPDDRRQADRLERLVGRSLADDRRLALDDERRRVGLADSIEKIAECLAVLGHPMASSGVPEQRIRALEDAGAASATARLSAVWPPSPARRPSGRSRAMTASTASTVSGSR
jgi:hypothetical protein